MHLTRQQPSPTCTSCICCCCCCVCCSCVLRAVDVLLLRVLSPMLPNYIWQYAQCSKRANPAFNYAMGLISLLGTRRIANCALSSVGFDSDGGYTTGHRPEDPADAKDLFHHGNMYDFQTPAAPLGEPICMWGVATSVCRNTPAGQYISQYIFIQYDDRRVSRSPLSSVQCASMHTTGIPQNRAVPPASHQRPEEISSRNRPPPNRPDINSKLRAIHVWGA